MQCGMWVPTIPRTHRSSRLRSNQALRAHVDVLLHPDHEEAVLSRPGTCLIVRAMMPGTLAIEVEPSQTAMARSPPPSTSSRLLKENLSRQRRAGHMQSAANRVSGLTADVRVLGHIAGIGDVYANANEWLAGPIAPSRIEGIAIEWPTKPEGVDIRYSVKTAQPLNISGRIVDLGAFAGTRGRAMPLTNLMLELSGPDASLYQFSVEALFLGSPVMRVSGERVVLSGPTGREPLVGLRVALEEAGTKNNRVSETSHGPVKPIRKIRRSRSQRLRRPARHVRPVGCGFFAAAPKTSRRHKVSFAGI